SYSSHVHPTSPSSFSLNTTAPSPIYPLSLHDALPIFPESAHRTQRSVDRRLRPEAGAAGNVMGDRLGIDAFDHPLHFQLHQLPRSEEHTSELQSRGHLVCRLVLEKKKEIQY